MKRINLILVLVSLCVDNATAQPGHRLVQVQNFRDPPTNVVLDTFGNELASDTCDLMTKEGDTKFHIVVRGHDQDHLVRVTADAITLDGVETGIDPPDETWNQAWRGIVVTIAGQRRGLYDPMTRAFVLAVEHSYIGKYGEGRLVVGDGVGWVRFFDVETRLFSEQRYRSATRFSEGHAIVENPNWQPTLDDPTHLVIDSNYSVVGPVEARLDRLHEHGPFLNDRACVRSKDGYYGYIRTDGTLAIPCVFQYARGFHQGVASAILPGTKSGEPYEAALSVVDPGERYDRIHMGIGVMIRKSGRIFDQLMSQDWYVASDAAYHGCIQARRQGDHFGACLLLDLDGHILWEEPTGQAPVEQARYLLDTRGNVYNNDFQDLKSVRIVPGHENDALALHTEDVVIIDGRETDIPPMIDGVRGFLSMSIVGEHVACFHSPSLHDVNGTVRFYSLREQRVTSQLEGLMRPLQPPIGNTRSGSPFYSVERMSDETILHCGLYEPATDRFVLEPEYPFIGNYGNGMHPVQIRPLEDAYFDVATESLLPRRYVSATPFSNGLACVVRRPPGFAGPSDAEMRDMYERQRKNPFASLRTEQKRPNERVVIDSEFQQLSEPIAHQSVGMVWYDGRTIARLSPKRYGIIDTRGDFVVPPVFEFLTEIVEGRAIARIPLVSTPVTDQPTREALSVLGLDIDPLSEEAGQPFVIDTQTGRAIEAFLRPSVPRNSGLRFVHDRILMNPSERDDKHGMALLELDGRVLWQEPVSARG
ncbi:unnamed protein product [Symbiodinium necroappetens]|uniref:Uncharacterized protein n=1 Tax=Symbiodinium necroappetens TaxID=1628268 RepID=A0A812PSF6_9DINO|nr:unnamed protein product [Symbiodinium necroappetens]